MQARETRKVSRFIQDFCQVVRRDPTAGAFVSGTAPHTSYRYVAGIETGKNMYQNAAWDFRTYSLDRDLRIADHTGGRQVNAIDPNVKAFEKGGGRLIIYQGWNDPAVPPMGTVDYYNNMVTKMGRKDTESFGRLYMVPGLQHCYGGPGPNTFGATMTAALERWVEDGVAPGAIIATKYKTDGDITSGVVRTRPLCPYPQVARYKGTGSTDEAANFACNAP
jgi:Tannase and feruloyl esterase